MEQVVADIRNSLVRLELRMEAGFEKIGKKLEKIDERFDKVDAHFDKVDARFDKVYARFDKVEAKIERLLFLGIAAVVAIFATIAHALHWW